MAGTTKIYTFIARSSASASSATTYWPKPKLKMICLWVYIKINTLEQVKWPNKTLPIQNKNLSSQFLTTATNKHHHKQEGNVKNIVIIFILPSSHHPKIYVYVWLGLHLALLCSCSLFNNSYLEIVIQTVIKLMAMIIIITCMKKNSIIIIILLASNHITVKSS